MRCKDLWASGVLQHPRLGLTVNLWIFGKIHKFEMAENIDFFSLLTPLMTSYRYEIFVSMCSSLKSIKKVAASSVWVSLFKSIKQKHDKSTSKKLK